MASSYDAEIKEIDWTLDKSKKDVKAVPVEKTVEKESIVGKEVDINMDKHMKLFVKMVRDNTVETLESGSITDPMQQYSFIGSQLEKLVLLRNDEITGTIEKYFSVQNALKDKIEGFQKEINKCLDEYAENAKSIYEEIKKL